MKKILAIGNSFSMNATQYFNEISYMLNSPAFITNLYIPGCSLKAHSQNIDQNTPYTVQVDALKCGETTLFDALNEFHYDAITLQQASDYNGIIDSIDPHISTLISTIHRTQRSSDIYYHETWSYDSNSTHPAFVNYNFDSDKMQRMIHTVASKISSTHNLPIIKTGTALHTFRKLENFPHITKDGYHLKNGPIRIIASLVWFHIIVRNVELDDIKKINNYYRLDPQILDSIYNSIQSL